MKRGYESLQALAAEIERRSNAKKDLVAFTKRTEAFVGRGDEPRIGVATGSAGSQDFSVNAVAHRQIQGHLNIPAQYYDRMLREDKNLWAANVNTWFHKAEAEKRLLRTMDGTLRAFLSDRYKPLENEDLARAVLPVLRDLKVEIMSSQVTDTRFYIKAVHSDVVRVLAEAGGKFGDGGHTIVKRPNSPAITISNSEVGMGALSVLVGLYDSFCSNLATFAERSARKYHVGSRHEMVGEEAYALLSDDTRRKTDAALWAQIGDVTRGAFDQVQFNALCDKVEATREDKVEGDVVEFVNFASTKFGMTEKEGGDVLKHLIAGGDLTRFGLYNAVTRTAEDLPDYDRASEFERIGGKVIELGKSEWKELAKAA